jgi:excisionase family DNA binding protein
MNSPQQPKRRQYESISEAAARVGVSIKTIRRWIASGHLAGYRMGPRLLRIDPDELDGMLTLIPTVASRRRRPR